MTEFLPELIAAGPVIISLIILEGLLSVDNSLIIASMVGHLPTEGKFNERKWAFRIGLGAAYVMRLITLFFVSYLIANPWIKVVGAAYLVYLMFKHLAIKDVDSHGVAEQKAGFWGTVMAISLADLAFSVDNVIAAAALSPKYWVIVTGVLIGIVAMQFVAQAFVGLIKRFPILEPVAYVLVGFVGLQLLAEHYLHFHTTELVKFLAIMAIIGGGLVYERVTFLQTVFGPVFNWLGRLMGKVTGLIDTLLEPFYALGAGTVKVVRKFIGK